MTPNKSWFEKFTDLHGGPMLLGNNKSYKIQGIWSIRFKLHDIIEKDYSRGEIYSWLNVISLGELIRKHCLFQGENNILWVMKDPMIVMRGCKEEWSVLIGRRGSSWVSSFSFYKKYVKNWVVA